MVFERKGRIALQAGHALPVKWCLNEKVELLCKLKWTYVRYTDTMPRMPRLSSGRIALQAGHASPVKLCLNEKVELPCKLAMPRLSSGVRKKRFC